MIRVGWHGEARTLLLGVFFGVLGSGAGFGGDKTVKEQLPESNRSEIFDFLRWLLGGAAALLFVLLILGLLTVRVGGFCLGHCQ